MATSTEDRTAAGAGHRIEHAAARVGDDGPGAGPGAAADSRAALWRRRLPSIAALLLVFVVAWVLDPPCC